MRVLLVDHDSEGLEAVSRAIRGVLDLDSVTSKGDALLLLRQNTYDVLIACERCVDGSGLDLLGRTTRTAVPLKRIFAAAPERLQLLGPRLAPFKVQRTINYPIDLEELWLAIAQVTGGPNDETDGTIERVVLDERGIPSTGTVPRSPIPPRPPAPLAAVPPPPPPAPAVSSSTSGRYATARLQQPVPEPPLRAPPPPRQPPQVRAPAPPAPKAPPAPPARTSDTGRMRALAPQMKPIPPMPISPPLPNGAAAPRDFPAWTPEPFVEDDFAAVAEQARLGVQQKVVDEASRRKRTRLFVAGGVALAVAGLIVFLIEKFYDPEARAREQAIAQEVQRLAEQQKVTDDLTRIEIDIETAIMENRLDVARGELATLVERSPNHPRREFLQDAIDRAAELAKLSGQGGGKSASAPAPAQVAAAAAPPRAETRTRSTGRAERPSNRTPERTPPRNAARADTSPTPQQRAFGAPIGEQPRAATIPLNAPINAPPTTSVRRIDSGFPGRTVEASDSAGTPASAPPPPPPATQAYVPAPAPSSAPQSGSAAAEPKPAAPTASVDVTPAKLVRRVMPVLGTNVSRKASGFVVVSFTINEKGRVNDVNVVESTPPGVFDDAAQAAVRKWVYEPRKENGVEVASKGQVKLVFEPE
jgi:TonB family protein